MCNSDRVSGKLKGAIKNGRLNKIIAILIRVVGMTKDAKTKNAPQKRKEMVDFPVLNNLEEAQKIAKMGSWEWDVTNDTMNWSAEMYRILDLQPGQAWPCMQTFLESICSKDRNRVQKALSQSVISGENIDMQFKILTGEGGRKYIRSQTCINKNDSGIGVSVKGTMHDITDHIRLLREEKRRLAFEHKILLLAQEIISAPLESFPEIIINSMKLIAGFCGVDRVILYRYKWEKGIILRLLEWDRKPSYCLGDNCETTVLKEKSGEIKRHKKGQTYLWNAWDLEHKGDKDKENQSFDHITSLCSCPLLIQGKAIGKISLSTVKKRKKWRQFEINALKDYCVLMANIMQREENEKSLRELSGRHRMILDALDEGVGMIDRTGTFLSANRHLAQKNNKSIEGVIGTKLEDYPSINAGEVLDRRIKELNRVFETKEPVFSVEEFNGQWASSRLYPVIKDGEVTSVALISSDITDRIRVEDEIRKNALLEKEAEMLRKKEQEYLEILDGSSLSSWIYDMKKKTLRLSAKWKKRIGAEHISDGEMDQFVDGLVHPDDLQELSKRREETLKEKAYRIRNIYRHKICGEKYIWVLDQGKVEYDKNGMPVRIYGTTTDITDKVEADKQLRSVKDDLAAEVEVLNTIHRLELNLIAQNDSESANQEILRSAISVTSAQKGSISIYLSNENVFKTITAINFNNELPGACHFIPVADRVFEKLLGDKKRIVIDDIGKYLYECEQPVLRYLVDEGIQIIQFTPLVSSTGRLTGVLSTYHHEKKTFHDRELRMLDLLSHMAADAIERISMEKALMESEKHALALVEELKKTDKNKNKFISVLSHELRNPLAALDSGMMLLETTRDDSERNNAMVIMGRQIDYLRGLVDDLLDLTRISQNMLKLEKEKVDICQIVAHAAGDMRPQFKTKNIRLIENIQSNPIYIYADPLRITQVIENLLSNALKFTEDGGLVALYVSKEEDHATVSVADNGVGIRAEILPDIFEAFTRDDTALTITSWGLGLGLAIAKNIACLHGGNIEVRSEGVGKGAVFILHLPMLSDMNVKQSKTSRREQSGFPVNILIVEDNKSLAEIQSSLFKIMGHDVTTVHNGYEGIKEALEKRPDVILCDIGMPGLSGYDVAKSIRADARLDNTILIALTGYASETEKRLALESGFDMHLSKPVSMEVLEKIFSEAFKKKQISDIQRNDK